MKKGTVSMAITTIIRLGLAFFAVATCRAGTLTIRDVDRMMASVDANEDKCHGLLRAIDIRPDDAEVERHIVDKFISLPYARLPVSKAVREVDFSARIKCVYGMAEFSVISDDTNVLASVCRRLEELSPLPTQSRLEDLAAARNLLLHLCYTQEEINKSAEFKPGGKAMHGAMLIHPEFCSLFEDIRNEYDARERYNKALETYKRKTLEILKPNAMSEGTEVFHADKADKSQESTQMGFPPLSYVRNAFREVQTEFYRASDGDDCWRGFLPVLGRIRDCQDEAPMQDVRDVESFAVTNFTLYAFASEEESAIGKANFRGRLMCLELLSQFTQVRRDKRLLYAIADWMSMAVELPCDDEKLQADIIKAHLKDNTRIFGGNQPRRVAGGISAARKNWGPEARACMAKYEFRRLYNKNLREFREEAVSLFRRVIATGYKDSTVGEREEIWEEFCRRAKATEREKTALSEKTAENLEPK